MDFDLEELDRQKAQKARAFKPALKPTPRARPGGPSKPSGPPVAGPPAVASEAAPCAQAQTNVVASETAPQQLHPIPLPSATTESKVVAPPSDPRLALRPATATAPAPNPVQPPKPPPRTEDAHGPTASDPAPLASPATDTAAAGEVQNKAATAQQAAEITAFGGSLDDLLNWPSQPRQSKFAPSTAGRRPRPATAATAATAPPAPVTASAASNFGRTSSAELTAGKPNVAPHGTGEPAPSKVPLPADHGYSIATTVPGRDGGELGPSAQPKTASRVDVPPRASQQDEAASSQLPPPTAHPDPMAESQPVQAATEPSQAQGLDRAGAAAAEASPVPAPDRSHHLQDQVNGLGGAHPLDGSGAPTVQASACSVRAADGSAAAPAAPKDALTEPSRHPAGGTGSEPQQSGAAATGLTPAGGSPGRTDAGATAAAGAGAAAVATCPGSQEAPLPALGAGVASGSAGAGAGASGRQATDEALNLLLGITPGAHVDLQPRARRAAPVVPPRRQARGASGTEAAAVPARQQVQETAAPAVVATPAAVSAAPAAGPGHAGSGSMTAPDASEAQCDSGPVGDKPAEGPDPRHADAETHLNVARASDAVHEPREEGTVAQAPTAAAAAAGDGAEAGALSGGPGQADSAAPAAASSQPTQPAPAPVTDLLGGIVADLDALPKQQRRAAPTVVARRRPGAAGAPAPAAAAAAAPKPVPAATIATPAPPTQHPQPAPSHPHPQPQSQQQQQQQQPTAAPVAPAAATCSRQALAPRDPRQGPVGAAAAAAPGDTVREGSHVTKAAVNALLAAVIANQSAAAAGGGSPAAAGTASGAGAAVKTTAHTREGAESVRAAQGAVGMAPTGKTPSTTEDGNVEAPPSKRRRTGPPSAAAAPAAAPTAPAANGDDQTAVKGAGTRRGSEAAKRPRRSLGSATAADAGAEAAAHEAGAGPPGAGTPDGGEAQEAAPPAKRARGASGAAKPRQRQPRAAGAAGGDKPRTKASAKDPAVAAETRRRRQLANVAATTQLMFKLVQSASTHSSKKGAMAWVRLLSTLRSSIEQKKLAAARGGAAGPSGSQDQDQQAEPAADMAMALIVHPDHQIAAAKKPARSRRPAGAVGSNRRAPRVPKPRSQGGSAKQESAAAAAREARAIREAEAEALKAAGLQVAVLPRVDPNEVIDPETWSLRRIIARTQAWERAKMAEEKAAAKAAAAAAAAAAEGAPAVEGAGAAPAGGGGAAAPARAAGAAGGGGAGPAAPQVRIVDGRLVVDTESLTVTAQERDDVQAYTRVEEDTRYVTSFTYMKRLVPARWSEADTALFYRALAAFGTDFSLICMLFPEMQRAHVKRKFTKELKENPNKVNAALSGQVVGAGRGINQAQLLEMVRARIAAVNEAQQASQAGVGVLPAPPTRTGEAEDQEGGAGEGAPGRTAAGPRVQEAEAEEVVVGTVAEGGEDAAGGQEAGGGAYGGAYGGNDDMGGYHGGYGGYEDEYDAYY